MKLELTCQEFLSLYDVLKGHTELANSLRNWTVDEINVVGIRDRMREHIAATMAQHIPDMATFRQWEQQEKDKIASLSRRKNRAKPWNPLSHKASPKQSDDIWMGPHPAMEDAEGELMGDANSFESAVDDPDYVTMLNDEEKRPEYPRRRYSSTAGKSHFHKKH